MTPHEVVRPSRRIRACKAGAFAIVSLLLLIASAQGELLAVCGDGVIDGVEACDLGPSNGATGVCCSVSCTIDTGNVCRSAVDACDIAELCTGGDPFCPADGFAFGGLCRPAQGECDVPEFCTGSSPSCPVDEFVISGTFCRFAMDPFCDLDETCTGSDPFCPPDEFQPDGTPCFDDGQFCNGAEVCQNGFCQGFPVFCDDGDPCTADNCDEEQQGCTNVQTPDQETPAGADGLCDTIDDNLPLYGVDQECGTGDDLTGDGFCSGVDNCDFDYNPVQQDADNDSQGNACDATPCQVQGLVATGNNELFSLDPATGNASTFPFPLPPDLTDVAVDPTGTFVVVSSFMAGTASVFDLSEGSIFPDIPLSGPWGVDFGGASQMVYVVEQSAGVLTRFHFMGGGVDPPITSLLTGPVGLDVNAAETFAFVTEPSLGSLRRVNIATGALSTITAGLSSPQGVVLDASETNAYVVESSLGHLSRVHIATGNITVVATGLGNPQGVALDATETYAYVTVPGSPQGVLHQVELSTGLVTPIFFDAPGFLNGGVALGPPAPARISLQNGASAPTSSTTLVPVMVDDLTGLGVLSVDLTLQFNPDVVAITTIADGSLTGACTLTSNLATPGQATISIFCTSPLSGAGSLAQLTLSAIGASGQGSPLDIAMSLLNEGNPAHCADEGTFFVPVGISGTIMYYRNHLTGTEPSTKPVDNIDVGLYNSFFDIPDPEFLPEPVLTDETDCSGVYGFLSLEPIQQYVVVPRKANDALGAIDPFDAALNAQHVVGLTTLTTNQRLAADATGNGSLTSFDSARIAQLSVGLIAQLPVASFNGSDWTFVPTPQPEPNQGVFPPFPPMSIQGGIDYRPLIESAENQDFRGILYGDVSGNWQGVCPSALPPGGTAPDAAMAPGLGGPFAGVAPATAGATGPALLLPSLAASKGQTVRVPIRARELPAAVSFYMDLRYDPSVVRLVRVESGASTASRFSLTPNIIEAGRARVALFSATQLGGSDSEIAVAVFEVVGAAGASSRVAVATWTVNEGQLPASVSEGNIRVLSLRNPLLK